MSHPENNSIALSWELSTWMLKSPTIIQDQTSPTLPQLNYFNTEDHMYDGHQMQTTSNILDKTKERTQQLKTRCFTNQNRYRSPLCLNFGNVVVFSILSLLSLNFSTARQRQRAVTTEPVEIIRVLWYKKISCNASILGPLWLILTVST